jgi:hypothetical protein
MDRQRVWYFAKMSLAILYWQFAIAAALGFAAPEGNHTAQPFEIKDLTA